MWLLWLLLFWACLSFLRLASLVVPGARFVLLAVLLGWLLAGEALNARVIVAGIVTLTAVFLISRGTGEKRQVVTEEMGEMA